MHLKFKTLNKQSFLKWCKLKTLEVEESCLAFFCVLYACVALPTHDLHVNPPLSTDIHNMCFYLIHCCIFLQVPNIFESIAILVHVDEIGRCLKIHRSAVNYHTCWLALTTSYLTKKSVLHPLRGNWIFVLDLDSCYLLIKFENYICRLTKTTIMLGVCLILWHNG